MDNPKAESPIKVWLPFAVSTCGMIVFALLYFSSPKAATSDSGQVQVITKTVTNEVVREITKEVEKPVFVPAEIPPHYTQALQLYSNYLHATAVKGERTLFGMDGVRTFVFLNDAAKKAVSEDEVRAKFELVLRKNNVVIDSKSEKLLGVLVEGIWSGEAAVKGLLVFHAEAKVVENQILLRGSEIHEAPIQIWEKSYYGSVGQLTANEAILGNVEKLAEMFANDYLSANPK